MATWKKLSLAALGIAGTGVGLAIRLGPSSWRSKTDDLVENMYQSISMRDTKKVSFNDFDQLPVPVARYFRFALKEGQPLIRSARFKQEGEFRARRADDAWSPFEAKEYFSVRPPGLVWDASISMAPLISVRVRDAYVEGQGSMQGKILSLVPIVNQHGKAELNAGALQRYLAEAVWLPTALLPSEGITWSAIDNNSALATQTDSGTTVSLEFHFSNAGEITSVFTPGRYREVSGKYELTPWAGYFSNYEERDGMRIPAEGEVEWRMPGGRLPYWRGRIVEVAYDFAR